MDFEILKTICKRLQPRQRRLREEKEQKERERQQSDTIEQQTNNNVHHVGQELQ